MKKFNKNISMLLAATLFLFTGCTDFADTPGKSVWSEGLWLLPWITGLGSAFFFYIAYKSSKSGSNRIDASGKITNEEAGNVPIYEIGQFWFGVGLAIATIFIIWNTISNR